MNNIKTGLELEFEFKQLVPHDYELWQRKMHGTYWKWDEDGSLKENGAEFKLANPLEGEKLNTAIEQLPKILEGLGVSYKDYNNIVSDRTGFHIHMNVRGLNSFDVVHGALGLILFERLLFLLSTDSRNFSPFNQKVSATQLHELLIRTYKNLVNIEKAYKKYNEQDRKEIGRDKLRNLAATWPKYTSINLLPIRKLGSIEIRMIACFPHQLYIKNWVNLCHNIFSFGMNNPLTSSKVINKLYEDTKNPNKIISLLAANNTHCAKYLTEKLTMKQVQQSVMSGIQDITGILQKKEEPKKKKQTYRVNFEHIIEQEQQRAEMEIQPARDGVFDHRQEPAQGELEITQQRLNRRYAQRHTYDIASGLWFVEKQDGQKFYYKAKLDENGRTKRERTINPYRRD